MGSIGDNEPFGLCAFGECPKLKVLQPSSLGPFPYNAVAPYSQNLLHISRLRSFVEV
jgi:hypothetical protein